MCCWKLWTGDSRVHSEAEPVLREAHTGEELIQGRQPTRQKRKLKVLAFATKIYALFPHIFLSLESRNREPAFLLCMLVDVFLP